jgi:hypothetical protein
MSKLEAQHIHILELIKRDANPNDGWTRVSEQLYPVISGNIPRELATFEKWEIGGRARLTEEGKHVLDALKWIQ